MKLNANKFAVAIWVVAAMLVVVELLSQALLLKSNMNFAVFFSELPFALLYGGGLAILGAGIHLLGEIRDRLPERSN